MSEAKLPEQSTQPDCWQLVIADMEARRKLGIDRYGKPVRPGEEDFLQHLAEELYDASVYLKAHRLEVEALRARVTQLEGVLKPFAWVGEHVYETVSDATQHELAIPYGIGLPNAGEWRAAAAVHKETK